MVARTSDECRPAAVTVARPSASSGRPALIVAVGAAAAIAVLVALRQSEKPFYYDSGLYWELRESFIQGGHFSLLNFSNPLRGYALPLVYDGLGAVGDWLRLTASATVRIFNGLLFAAIGALLMPALAEATWPQRRWGMGRRVALTGLLLVFWGGFLNYPLSDFPALAMALLALVAITHADSPAWMLLAGVAAGLAVEMRPAYVLLAPLLLALLLWAAARRSVDGTAGSRRARRRARTLLSAALLVAGFAAAALPQSLAAHRFYGTWSFIPGASANLSNLQLTDGLYLQRYDTYVGAGHPPGMHYLDPSGAEIQRSLKNGSVEGLGEYLGLVASHPVGMGGVFARHLINGLDARYTTPYVEHLGGGTWRRVAGFLLVFAALTRLLWPAGRRALGRARWRYVVALLACCVTALPSAVETRYLLALDLLVYMVVLAPGWPTRDELPRTRSARIRAVALIAGAGVLLGFFVWHVTSGASAHLQLS